MNKSSYSFICIAFMLSACSNISTPVVPAVTKTNLQGSWLVEFIEQRPVIDRSPASITFTEDGRLSGNSSCNRLMSSYQLTKATDGSNSKLHFSQAAGTMMMCAETLMNQEQRFLTALTKVTQVTIEHGLLMLTDDNHQVIFKASKK
ncbi:MAG: META domain-containing protein [Colwellia sp.]|nr:META domain-containing protein [Colwellia sp.]